MKKILLLASLSLIMSPIASEAMVGGMKRVYSDNGDAPRLVNGSTGYSYDPMQDLAFPPGRDREATPWQPTKEDLNCYLKGRIEVRLPKALDNYLTDPNKLPHLAQELKDIGVVMEKLRGITAPGSFVPRSAVPPKSGASIRLAVAPSRLPQADQSKDTFPGCVGNLQEAILRLRILINSPTA